MQKLLLAAVVSAACACTAWAVRPSAFATQSRPMKASVRILAISSSSRQSFAGNQDIYIADVQVKDGMHEFARIIDQYPGFGLPIRTSLLHEHTQFTMKVTREPECDVPGSQVYLSPSSSVVFDGSVRDALTSRAGEAVPCFRTLHQTIALPHK